MNRDVLKKWLRFILAGILVSIAIIYTMFPADLIPDITPIFGLLDDLGIDIVAIINFIRKVRELANKYK